MLGIRFAREQCWIIVLLLASLLVLPSIACDQNIVGLDVAVENPALVAKRNTCDKRREEH